MRERLNHYGTCRERPAEAEMSEQQQSDCVRGRGKGQPVIRVYRYEDAGKIWFNFQLLHLLVYLCWGRHSGAGG